MANKIMSFRRLLMAVGLLLVLDGLFLFTRRVSNLGALLPFFGGVALCTLGFYWLNWQTYLSKHLQLKRLWRLACAGVFVWLFTVLAFFWNLHQSTMQERPQGFEPVAIIVLGSSTPGGKPSPTLAARLDVAKDLAIQYKDARLVMSGGIDFNQSKSEAFVMAEYLQAVGTQSNRFLLEDKSRSTFENLQFSLALLRKNGASANPALLVVSSDFHLLRASWIARKAGLSNVQFAGASTPLYVRYNAWLREYFACALGLFLGEF